MNNFNRIAAIYDTLVRLVFGRSIQHAQTLFLKKIPLGGHVLILGGGTGWLLAYLLSLNASCKVVYIDASKRMIEMAKKKNSRSNDIIFIHGTEKAIPPGLTFDAIITHFYLDLFETDSCGKIVRLIRDCCHGTTLWLACDFMKVRWWHSALLSVMYLFFKIVSNLNTKELPDWKKAIEASGFLEISAQDFSKGFISSALFQLRDESPEDGKQA